MGHVIDHEADRCLYFGIPTTPEGVEREERRQAADPNPPALPESLQQPPFDKLDARRIAEELLTIPSLTDSKYFDDVSDTRAKISIIKEVRARWGCNLRVGKLAVELAWRVFNNGTPRHGLQVQRGVLSDAIEGLSTSPYAQSPYIADALRRLREVEAQIHNALRKARRREPRTITAHGETLTVKQWAERTGLAYSTIYERRFTKGLSGEASVGPRAAWFVPKGQARSRESR